MEELSAILIFQEIWIPASLSAEDAFLGLDIIKKDTLGSLITMVIRGDRQKTEEKLRALQPIFLETLPLTLEEVFISEMEAAAVCPF